MKNSNAAVIAIVALFAGALAGNMLSSQPAASYEYASPSTDGLTRVDIGINLTTVHLSDGCYEVSFDITEDQAYSVSRGLGGTIGARPLTHDIIKDILDSFDFEVEQIKIDRYIDEIYYATIILRQGNRVLEMDVRPSDAMAIALRMGKPLYFDTEILRQHGEYTCALGG